MVFLISVPIRLVKAIASSTKAKKTNNTPGHYAPAAGEMTTIGSPSGLLRNDPSPPDNEPFPATADVYYVPVRTKGCCGGNKAARSCAQKKGCAQRKAERRVARAERRLVRAGQRAEKRKARAERRGCCNRRRGCGSGGAIAATAGAGLQKQEGYGDAQFGHGRRSTCAERKAERRAVRRAAREGTGVERRDRRDDASDFGYEEVRERSGGVDGVVVEAEPPSYEEAVKPTTGSKAEV